VVIIIRWNSRFNLRNALPRLVAQTQKATFREEDLSALARTASVTGIRREDKLDHALQAIHSL